MDVASFVRQHPEFAQSDQNTVQAALVEAAAFMGGPARCWGSFATPGNPLTFADIAQGYRAADTLATTPYGTETRLQPDGKETIYAQRFREMAAAVGGGVTVAMGGPAAFPFGPWCF